MLFGVKVTQRMSKCAKCKCTLLRVGDTWCLGCSGWEAIGLELSSSWSSPGLRRLGEDLVVQTARNLRALRSSGAGSGLASLHAGTSVADHPKAPTAEPGPLKGVASKSNPAPSRGAEEESEYTYDYSGGEEVGAEAAKPLDSKVVVRPELPRPFRESARASHPVDLKKAVKEEECSPPRDRSRGRRHKPGSRGREERENARRNRRRSEDRDIREGGHKRKRKRGGRKHQRLSRLESNPLLPHHRKLSSAFLEERVGLRD